ncbi:MAG TPA: hypothetical protein VIY52_33175 [Streptosporangiaceae bacterium]
MQLLTKAADRLLSAVVPHVTAGACLQCPPSWKVECGCSSKGYVKYKICARTGCLCTGIECGPCNNVTGISCS